MREKDRFPGRFEKLEHRVLDGTRRSIPLFIDDEDVVGHNSRALLVATNLIGAKLASYPEFVAGMVDEVGQLLSGEDDQRDRAILVEDDAAAGAILIDSAVTKVTTRNHGELVVPTDLFFDMLYTWDEYLKRPELGPQETE